MLVANPALPGSAAELGCWMSQQPARGTNLSVCSSEIIMVSSLRFFKFWGLSHAAWHPDWVVWLFFSFFFFNSVEEKHRLYNSPFPQWPLLFSKASNKPKRSGKFVCIYFFVCVCVYVFLCVCVCAHLHFGKAHLKPVRQTYNFDCTVSIAWAAL